MKKIITLILTLTFIMTSAFVFSSVVSADIDENGTYNLLDAKTATFEGGLGSWIKGLEDGVPAIAKDKGRTGDAMLSGPRTKAWAGGFLDVAPIILANGDGVYDFSFYAMAADEEGDGTLRLMFRDATGEYGFPSSEVAAISVDEYTLLEISFEITEVDKAAKTFVCEVAGENYTVAGALNLTFDNGIGPVYIDDVCIVNMDTVPTPVPTPSPTPSPVPTASPIPTATPIATIAATTTAPATTDATTNDGKGSPLVIILIISAVILLGGGVALLLIKSKKPADTDK